MGVRVVRHDKHRRRAASNEMARHTEDKVRVLAVHLLEEGITDFDSDVCPVLAKRRRPSFHIALIEPVRYFRPKPARRCWDGRDHALGRPLQHVPDKGAADAKPKHHELVDPPVIHQAKLVVGIRVPWPVNLHWTRRFAADRVPQVHRNATVFVGELMHCQRPNGIPPTTASATLVTKLDLSLARQTISSATFAAWPARRKSDPAVPTALEFVKWQALL